MKARIFLFALWLSVVAFGITSCASVPAPIVVTGNGQCHPAPDLPAHKTMKKVPETDTFMEDVFGLLLSERHDHAADVRDYNSLYDTCVAK